MRQAITLSFLALVLLLGGLFAGSSVTAQGDPTVPPTNTPRGNPPPTEIPTDLPTATATLTPTATATDTPTPSPTSTLTSTFTETPTAEPTQESADLVRPTVFYPPNFTPEAQVTAIPTAMPRWGVKDQDNNDYDYINVLLVGHDSESGGEDNIFRTDTMIVVNINLTTNTVSMLALPRDLLVWISQWQMERLNLAWGRGDLVGWTDGGWGLLRQTVLYNFGIELHYYAMVDFTGFKTIIDRVGGVTIAVDCPIQGVQFTGDYDDNGEPTFAVVTMPVGVHHMDSREALWYARTRKNSSDFDRGRRQQQVLRAILSQSKDLGFLTEFPSLWEEFNQVVKTNMPLSVIVQMLPLALQIEPNEIENHFFRLGLDSVSFTRPDGQNVQVPNPNGAMINLINNFLTPPTSNQLVTDSARVQIYDGSGGEAQWDWVAADRLAWEGIVTEPMGNTDELYPETILIDYSGETKGSVLDELLTLLNISEANIQYDFDTNADTDYAIFIGQNYNSCVDRQVQQVEYQPPATLTPIPGS